jgi:patatin-like phospholipase/acyl hydrolase
MPNQSKARSSYSSDKRREPIPWPADQPFRILSLDGGGIKGIFPAAILSELEGTLPPGHLLHEYFDLVAGTSTGGILAMGLGCSIQARLLLDLYLKKGARLFPPHGFLAKMLGYFQVKYDAKVLEALLSETFSDKTINDSVSRLCIPMSEGLHGEIFVVKTPHHPDYHLDGNKSLVKVGLATGAAPTFLKALDEWGYRFFDGGIWANNPIMVAVVEAMTVFNVPRQQIHVLSIGCGAEPFVVTNRMVSGGLLRWRRVIDAAINLQTQSALGQAQLLLGPKNVIRLEPKITPPIDLDDWTRSSNELPAEAHKVFLNTSDIVRRRFTHEPAQSPIFFRRSEPVASK